MKFFNFFSGRSKKKVSAAPSPPRASKPARHSFHRSAPLPSLHKPSLSRDAKVFRLLGAENPTEKAQILTLLNHSEGNDHSHIVPPHPALSHSTSSEEENEEEEEEEEEEESLDFGWSLRCQAASAATNFLFPLSPGRGFGPIGFGEHDNIPKRNTEKDGKKQGAYPLPIPQKSTYRPNQNCTSPHSIETSSGLPLPTPTPTPIPTPLPLSSSPLSPTPREFGSHVPSGECYIDELASAIDNSLFGRFALPLPTPPSSPSSLQLSPSSSLACSKDQNRRNSFTCTLQLHSSPSSSSSPKFPPPTRSPTGRMTKQRPSPLHQPTYQSIRQSSARSVHLPSPREWVVSETKRTHYYGNPSPQRSPPQSPLPQSPLPEKKHNQAYQCPSPQSSEAPPPSPQQSRFVTTSEVTHGHVYDRCSSPNIGGSLATSEGRPIQAYEQGASEAWGVSKSPGQLVHYAHNPSSPQAPSNSLSPSSHSPQSFLSVAQCPRKWSKGQRLGQGSFGTVYEGINKEDGSFFAVKISHDANVSPDTQQEVAVLSRLSHPNIVRYLGSTLDDDSHLCIFLEMVTMGSVASILKKYNRLEENVISAYTRQILLGLDYLHAQKTIHRDIKCANILVDVNGQVKLADFGVAKKLDQSMAQSCKGTPVYMAPEVIKAKPGEKSYGPSADIWSLGCTVIEMADGKPPWSDQEMYGFFFSIKNGELPQIPELLSSDAKDFISKCLKLRPEERLTASELLKHPFIVNAPTVPPPLPALPLSPPRSCKFYPSMPPTPPPCHRIVMHSGG